MKKLIHYSVLLFAVVFIYSCSKEEESFTETQPEDSSINSEQSVVSEIEGESREFSYDQNGNAVLKSPDLDDINIRTVIRKAKKAAGAENLRVARIVYARGIQAYELNRAKKWNAKGPLADLYKSTILGDNTLGTDFREKKGTHYQHLSTPAWEFPGGRVIAEKAEPIPGAGSNDVAWLNVTLKPNKFNYKKILRILTYKGKAPRRTNFKNFTRTGSGYETVYVFLK